MYEFPATFIKARLHHRAVKFGYNPLNISNQANNMITSKK